MYSKENYKQGEKTTLRMEENNSKWNIWQKINLQNIQATHYNSIPEKQKTYSKSGEKTWTDISPKKTCRWLKNRWKDAHHLSLLKKCKSKPQWDITSHLSEWPSSKSLQITKVGEGMEKREPLKLFVETHWCHRYGNQYGGFSKN